MKKRALITEEDAANISKELDGLTQKWDSYECELMTPMYGGGVKPGEVDKEMPIRGSAIRGQLRFWWRVACAPGLPAEEMFKREAAIWGGIGDKSPTASQVAVRVHCAPVKDAEFVASTAEKHPAIRYAFGSAAINGDANWLKQGYKFKLFLCYSAEVAREVEVALSWWASFGGVGARTRRGFGAVRVDGVPIVSNEDVHKVGGWLELSAGGGGSKADAEWKNAVERLYSFRQKGGMGRKDNTPRPGRSFWPEPDQIRRFTGKFLPTHKPEHPAGNMFPRAAFGLPITFKFYSPAPENYAVELVPDSDGERMASPLILRPYWNGENWQPAALLLPGWEQALEQPLKFKGQNYQPAHWPREPARRKEMAGQIRPMNKDNGELRADDPLSAFMQFFAEGK